VSQFSVGAPTGQRRNVDATVTEGDSGESGRKVPGANLVSVRRVPYPWELEPAELEARKARGYRWKGTDFPVPTDAYKAHVIAGGRCSPDLISVFANCLLDGMSLKGACRMTGVNELTAQQWRQKGLEGTEPYATWINTVDWARSQVERKAVLAWTGAFDKDWRAAQAYLAVRQPDEYGPGATRVEIDQTVRTQVVHTLDEKQLVGIADVLREAGIIPQGGMDAIEADVVSDGTETPPAG